MNTSRILLRLVIIAVPALIAASVGVAFQALRITGSPQQFRSMAKLTVAGPNDSNAKQSQIDVDGMVIVPIESAEMKSRALKRVKALNPDLKEVEVVIRAAQTKGSGTVTILASSFDPKFSRIFLDALLDEFMIFSMKMLEEADGKTPQPQTAIAVQERATPAFEHLEDWRWPIAAGAAGGGLVGGLVGLLLGWILVRSPKPPQIPTAVG